MSTNNLGLEELGFTGLSDINRNLTVEELVELSLRYDDNGLGANGVLLVSTKNFYERRPQDKYYTDDPETSENIWWDIVNTKIKPETFTTLKSRIISHIKDKTLYVNDMFCGTDTRYRMAIRMITTNPWHSLFLRNLFILPTSEELESFKPDITLINGSEYKEKGHPNMEINSDVFIAINLKEKLTLIGGTPNSDEIKKAIFSMMNYYLPLQGILTLHGAANLGHNNDVALFLGQTGSGKTTLSTDPSKTSWHRQLIGDDAIAWSGEGIYSLEGGCYALCSNLDQQKEPDICHAIRYGAILENSSYNELREVDFTDTSTTGNIRVTYPLEYIHNSKLDAVDINPSNIFLLCNDMYGVLPPVAELTAEQAVFYYLCGFDCKSIKTDSGDLEIKPNFSECYASDFMPLRPNVYLELFAQKVKKFQMSTYLINTGWIGGPINVGRRIELQDTRKIIEAVLDGSIKNSPMEIDPVFGFHVPRLLTGVNASILVPANTWANKSEYQQARIKLAKLFIQHLEDFSQYGPQTNDVKASQYLFKEYNMLSQAGPHLEET